MKSASNTSMRYAAAGMIGLAVAMGIGRFIYTPILPGMMEELHLSASDAGLIASANYLGYLVGALLAAGGWAHGRERSMMLVGLGGTAVLAALMGVTDAMVPFLVIRFLAGVASAFVMVFLTSIVFSHLAAADRNGLHALHFGGVGLGIAISAALLAVLVTEHSGWTAGWYWSAIISACGFVAVVLMARGGPLGNGTEGREPRLPKDRSLTRVIIAYGLFGFGYVVTATFLIAIVRQDGGGRVFETMVWLVTGLVGVPSVWVWNRIAARVGLYAAYVLACLVEAVGVAASVSLGGQIGPLLGGVLLGFTFIAATALGLQAGRMLAPRAPRRVFALMTASFGVGQIVGPLVAGLLAQWSGSFFVPSIAASIVLLLSAGCVWSARKPA
ncbi:YbfB/YjiJ family MFS transporter [Manganibacter manganicus]|nr:YbfB/YjiJ family MFS transporter [Pseudaminobacter manganicus]